MSRFKTVLMCSWLVATTACDQETGQPGASSAAVEDTQNSQDQDVAAVDQGQAAPEDVAKSSSFVDALVTPKQPPAFPKCPIMSDIPPDASGTPAVNPSGCPADGGGNFVTWVYYAWKYNAPIWSATITIESEKPKKWLALEDDTVWTTVPELSVTFGSVTDYLFTPGFKSKTLTVHKPGCYPWVISDTATAWAKDTYTKTQPKYCPDFLDGAQLVNGGAVSYTHLTLPTKRIV